ncbi:MoeA1 [Desulfamplus magnetovallimortis]|uniref:Molybdopterin molybdenumtransferase n=1 Tax=Desulfamplus magnetovallimortis TaxID=1246637 RepID=A0A1W1HGJ6_9BACT|nr:gephyrin-like molybdotransferase Glp [Desulfamplus magnetovallimortis]SLM31543.1 MoeA1 [Desulfamplus magnetovallimortis]
MSHFFKVKSLEQVISLVSEFSVVGTEIVSVSEALSRVLAVDICAAHDLPGFRRSTMDGYAVCSASTFGASESTPAWLDVVGAVAMGGVPDFSVGPGEAGKIATGGMLPPGADSVVMVEHTELVEHISMVDDTGVVDYTSIVDDTAVVDHTSIVDGTAVVDHTSIVDDTAMVDHTSIVDDTAVVDHKKKPDHRENVQDSLAGRGSIEVYKSVAPLQNVIEKDEDFKKGEVVLHKGTVLRSQEAGLAAALGIFQLEVYRLPKVGIISTGDEIVPLSSPLTPGKVRDVNSHTLASLVKEAGAVPVMFGIVRDNQNELFDICKRAIEQTDMVLISGGSSVGSRDFTVDVLSSLDATEIMVHGISISPGKPTILAGSRSGENISGENHVKAVWGLPGHVVSAMVVFRVVVLPFLRNLRGITNCVFSGIKIPAKLTRNVASAQGRTDYIRVKLVREDGNNPGILAVPILGKSGLIRTMVMADGLLEVPENVEGIEKGDIVMVTPV